jgi:RNA polymerase sigma factor (sigma-70 family)
MSFAINSEFGETDPEILKLLEEARSSDETIRNNAYDKLAEKFRYVFETVSLKYVKRAPGWGSLEDVLGDAYPAIQKAINTFDPTKGTKFSTWLETIVDTRLFNIQQKLLAQKEKTPTFTEIEEFMVQTPEMEEEEGSVIEGTISGTDDPVTEVTDKLLQNKILEKLPPLTGKIYELRLQDVSYQEIAEQLNIPLSKVYSEVYDNLLPIVAQVQTGLL